MMPLNLVKKIRGCFVKRKERIERESEYYFGNIDPEKRALLKMEIDKRRKKTDWLWNLLEYLIVGAGCVFILCFMVYPLISSFWNIDKYLSPKKFWNNEVKKIEDSIRAKEAFLELEIKRLQTIKRQPVKDDVFDEHIETLVAVYKAKGKSEEEINEMIYKEKEEKKKIKETVDLVYDGVKRKSQEYIEKQKQEIIADKKRLEDAKKELMKHQ